jgi:hypothetical protein
MFEELTMETKQKDTTAGRRRFLVGAGAAGAAGAAAVVAARTGTELPSPQLAKAGEEATGYHVTEHIRNHYRTTKI